MTDNSIRPVVLAYLQAFRKDIQNPQSFLHRMHNHQNTFQSFIKQCKGFRVSPVDAIRIVHTFDKKLVLYPNQITSKAFWSRFTTAVRRISEASQWSKHAINTQQKLPFDIQIEGLLKSDAESIRQIKTAFGLSEDLVLRQFGREVSPYYWVVSDVGRRLIKNGEVPRHILPSVKKAYREIKQKDAMRKCRNILKGVPA